MPRFTLSHIFMGTALVAIIMALTQSEGCGTRYSMIEAISFSSDKSRIVVTNLNGRDAQTPMKGYKANVSRTVSWLETSTGDSSGIIHQDFRPGNSGPAFRLWYVGRTSAICDPSNDYVSMSEFGGGAVTLNASAVKPTVVNLQFPAFNIAYSQSGRFLAASGMRELAVLDMQNNTVAMRIQTEDSPFISASLMSFSRDESRIVVAGSSGVSIWDITTAKKLFTVVQGSDLWIDAIAAAPNDSVIVCSREWVRRYDFAGHVIATLAGMGKCLCSVSSDGNTLAVCDGNRLSVYDLRSNRLLRSLPFDGATALALSSNGSDLAVGDYDGHVTLIDAASGTSRWTTTPPGRFRTSWILPALFLLGWFYAVWWLSKRKKLTCQT